MCLVYDGSYISACVKKSSLSSARSIGDGDAVELLVSLSSSSNLSYSFSEVQAVICAINCCFWARKISCLVMVDGLGVLLYCGWSRKNCSMACGPQACKLVLFHHLILYLRTKIGI
ncbi:hypothetical protein MANES_04G041325v8 [Manihot esculenta]|uniref:Uncharacterized protein n=1 Tax=Manihot esculenta TaxID=3983 RepID=A0ACB7HU53_MANES|nr:hypothetical protein MANES_04G041325v8 [Manihot esculenta]